MSIDLSTGSNSYISLGDAVDVVNSTLPFTVACVFQSASIPGTLIGPMSQGSYTGNRGWGAFLYGASPKKAGAYFAPSFGGTQELDGSRTAITAGHGWYLGVINFYTSGLTIRSSNIFYSFTDASWSTVEELSGSASALTLEPPTAGDTTVIGALNIATIGNYMAVPLSWIAVWANDFGAAALDVNARTLDLVTNGAWGAVNNDYILFIPFTGAAVDKSSNHFDGTVIGGATYSAAGPGELPPGRTGDLSVTLGALTLAADATVTQPSPPIPPAPGVGHGTGGAFYTTSFADWLAARPIMGRAFRKPRQEQVLMVEDVPLIDNTLRENQERAALLSVLLMLEDEE